MKRKIFQAANWIHLSEARLHRTTKFVIDLIFLIFVIQYNSQGYKNFWAMMWLSILYFTVGISKIMVGVRTIENREQTSKQGFFLSLLRRFRWFCDKENREHIELIHRDLIQDIAAMKKERRSTGFIKLVIFWRVVFGAILPISVDAVMRGLEKVLPILKWLRKI